MTTDVTDSATLIKSINRNDHFTLAQKRVIKDVHRIGSAVHPETAVNTAAIAVNAQEIDALQAITANPDIYGSALLYGSVTWLSGLIFDVSAASYIIDGVTYTSAADTVTLTAADATNPRIDVIYADTSGLVGSIAGTPAADPAKPEIDPATQIELTFVTVAALATTPEDTGATLLYGENAGDPAEWDATESTAAARIDVADTSDPYAGTIAIAFTAAVNDDYVALTSGSAATLLSVGDMDSLETHIKASTWGNKQLKVAFFNGANRISSWVNIQDGTFGFDSTNTTDYQTVTIPNSNFSFSSATADSVRFMVAKGGGSITALLDQVRVQTGGGTTIINVTQGLTEDQLINNVRTWNVQQPFGNGTLTDGATIAWDLDTDPVATVTLDGNRTLSISNPRAGGTYILRVIQDGVTGSRTLTWDAAVQWAGGTAPTLSTAVDDEDVFSFVCFDGTNLVGGIFAQATA